DGTRVRAARPQSGKQAHRPFIPDRGGLDGVALPHHGQQRHDPVMGEIDLALLLQDYPLLEDDVLELRGEQCEVFRTKRSQKADCACPYGSDPVPPSAFLIVRAETAPTHGAPTTRPTCRRHW